MTPFRQKVITGYFRSPSRINGTILSWLWGFVTDKYAKTNRLVREYQDLCGCRSWWQFGKLEVSYRRIDLFEQLFDNLVFKAENTEEYLSLGSEFVALRIAAELLVSLRCKLRVFVITIDGPADVFCEKNPWWRMWHYYSQWWKRGTIQYVIT